MSSAHHAYLVTGESEEGINRALSFAEENFNIVAAGNPDVSILRYGLMSVDDARTLMNLANRRPVRGEYNVIIVAATRFFHEAQNALLKLFEEPPATTRLILVVPSEGNVIPTLRSRLISVEEEGKAKLAPIAEEFLAARGEAREKLIAKLLDRAKSDKDTEKAGARADAVALVEGLMRVGYEKHKKSPDPALTAFLSDLDRFLPILHERSAPLKSIFEHLLITLPKTLTL